jgi:hypothetical protein
MNRSFAPHTLLVRSAPQAMGKRPKLTVLTSEGKIRVHFIGLVDT